MQKGNGAEIPRPGSSRKRRGIPKDSQLKTKEFLGLVADSLGEHLPQELQDFRVRGPVFSLVGILYAKDPRIHYEVWVQRRTGRLELGLHFEAEAETNTRWLEFFGRQAPSILAALGPGVEAEQWTGSWTRLHESLPLEALTRQYAQRVAERLGTFISVLEPMRREGEALVEKL